MISGPDVDLRSGGAMSGTYVIPEFENYGIATGLINTVIPGPDNTIEIELSHPIKD